ncbi:MAG TPA: hypothetical protein VFP68_10785 [Burkholderiaceae bacterium]|nr:hypothetical protein [Burkholderiaceae bacterium]
MDARKALDESRRMVAELRSLVQRARAGQVRAAEAVKRCDEVLGPPVRGSDDTVPKDSRLAPSVKAHAMLIDNCRRAIDRARAGMVNDRNTIEALGELVEGMPSPSARPKANSRSLARGRGRASR